MRQNGRHGNTRNHRRRRAPVLARGIFRVAHPRAWLTGIPLYFKCLYSVAVLVHGFGIRGPRFKPQSCHLGENPNLVANPPKDTISPRKAPTPEYNAKTGLPIRAPSYRHAMLIFGKIKHFLNTVEDGHLAAPDIQRRVETCCCRLRVPFSKEACMWELPLEMCEVWRGSSVRVS